MAIRWDQDACELHLGNDDVSYVMRVLPDETLGHVYLGSALPLGGSAAHLPPAPFERMSDWIWVDRIGDSVGREFPTAGMGDFRVPALVIRDEHGSRISVLHFRRVEVVSGKPPLEGLPSTYVENDGEAETALVELTDPISGVEVTLRYTMFDDSAAIARSASIHNAGTSSVHLEAAMSLSVDLPDANWEMVQLSGAWARERQVVERRLAQGSQAVASQRGRSSHEHNPFLALRREHTTETAGEAIGFALLYSGNFLAEAEVAEYDTTRVRLGIHPESFSWRLEPGEVFETPEAVVVYTSDGMGAMSETFHRLFGRRLVRGPWRDRERPILINSWEATFFDVDQQRLLELAREAQRVGIELFVLDDGWFGRRNDDTSSLGDWTANPDRLPQGLAGIGNAVNELGMDFGIWIEPEMVSRDSDLFRSHPDWAIGSDDRPQSESRRQLVLDLTRSGVRDHLFEVLRSTLDSAPIRYVKWDMNRPITEPYSRALGPDRQGEFFHRYVLGLYELYERITQEFPDVLFESCASGGGRFDPGLLAYAPQGWASSSTDPDERLRIQWGASLLYPTAAIGAHVTPNPNWIVGRSAPYATKAAVAFHGAFGYELDLTTLSEQDRTAVADQIDWYKRRRELFQFGRFLRLVSPYDGSGDEAAWIRVAQDGTRAIAAWYRLKTHPNPAPMRLRLRGLDAEATYRVTVWPASADRYDRANEGLRSGADLMGFGLFRDVEHGLPEARGDHQAALFELHRIDDRQGG